MKKHQLFPFAMAMLLALPVSAQAQSRKFTLGNQGQPQLSEEDRAAGRDNQMIERLNSIEELMKQAQVQQAQQLELLQQQNQLLNQIYEMDAARYEQMQNYVNPPAATEQPLQP